MKKTADTQNRKKKAIKKALIALVIVFLSYVIFSVVASAIIYDSIFKNIKELGFSARYTYSHFANEYERRAVEFKSGKNTLRGYYYGENNGGDKLLIVVNGMGCPSEGHLNEITYFVDHGFTVFTYDATGIGESEGDSTVGLSQARLDLSACFDYLSDYEGQIFIYAHSVGAYSTSTLLPEDRISAAVLISGFDLPIDVMISNAKRYVWSPLADFEKPFLSLQHWFIFGDGGSISAVDCINESETPLAVYQAPVDISVPCEISIYGKRDKITNGNVSFYETRNGHSSAWLSDFAAEYVESLNAEYSALKKEYGNSIPKDVYDGFLSGIDYEKANELDTAFLDGVIEFFNNNAK